MGQFSHHYLQKAIYAALNGDSTLSALVSGVFDRPPQGTAFPYVTLGESVASDWSSKTTDGMEHHLTLHIWSREGGRKEAAAIMERVHTLLHQAELAVAGYTLVMLRFTGSNIALENDGWSYHGQMQFHALLQANA